jgi:hypothetical protein
MNTAAGFTNMRRPRTNSIAAISIVEVVIAMALVLIVLAAVFAMNGQLLGLLRNGKQSTYATELIAERMEQLRTCTWEQLTETDKFFGLISGGGSTATSTNLIGVTETFTVEPYVNPTNISFSCVRTPSGVQPVTGVGFPNETLVKVTIGLKWKTGLRDRERQFVTVMSRFRG